VYFLFVPLSSLCFFAVGGFSVSRESQSREIQQPQHHNSKKATIINNGTLLCRSNLLTTTTSPIIMSGEKEKPSKAPPPQFMVGPAAKRELRRALIKSTNPADTISNFQQTHSLHSMFAKAFGTTPQHEIKQQTTRSASSTSDDNDNNVIVESLDTNSILPFLTHLGASQFMVHKRISDALQKELETEIRKTSQEPLLNLLKSCWSYATVLPELRPVLWAVLKQLGDQTPLAVLLALAERDTSAAGVGGKKLLKHAEIFRPLPPLLKRLVWEADWDDKVLPFVEKEETTVDNNNNPKQQYLKLIQSTLLCETVEPLVDTYCSNPVLVESVRQPFVSTARERRVLTTQRRALVSTTTTTTSSTTTSTTSLAGNKTTTPSASSTTPSSEFLSSGKAVSHLRQLLGDTTGGTASYRPKLLHAILSMLMARHGSEQPNLTGPHLHCTLVADILLSAGGPLPKAYTHVHSLARILDDAVKVGVVSDKDLVQIQVTLAQIYQPDQDDEDDDEGDDGDNDGDKKKKSKKSKKDNSALPTKEKTDQPTTFLKRQLNIIITAGLNAMKDADPQNLFLNPVTDAIAPGYSKVIKTPICIVAMHEKIEENEYNSIIEWEADVQLLFKNCITYNRGHKWFVGEANRQLKVFKDEILSQARKLYQVELARRNPCNDLLKRKREEPTGPTIIPLPAANKKRKKEMQEYTPSMPALASMLLADPFVVRLFLDRVLRSLRIDVLRGSSLPAAHSVVPSLMQLLHMAQWSTHICAVRGKRYLVPDGGLIAPSKAQTVEMIVPYNSLRKYLPVLMHLLLEAELDKRLVVGGDFHPVAQALHDSRPPPPSIALQDQVSPHLLQVAVSLLEGACCHICLPGNSQDTSLSVTFVKFAKTLESLAGSIWEERAFFVCLTQAILRHKTRLNRNARDVIIKTWMDWLKSSSASTTKKTKKPKHGSITSAAHEYLVHLINEWAALGNVMMPRDLLLKVTSELVETVNTSESERKFALMWEAKDSKDFEPIKKQYERMLGMLPASHSAQWKEQVGISSDGDDGGEEEQVEEEAEGEKEKDDPMEAD
jgi:hypothetical protein